MKRSALFLLLTSLGAPASARSDAGSDLYVIEAVAERRTAPSFPIAARDHGGEGEVDLRFGIDRLGRIVDVRVASASGHPAFRNTALATVKRWRFEPAFEVRSCRSLGRQVEQRIAFRRDAKGVGFVELAPMRLAPMPGDPEPSLVTDAGSMAAELQARDIVIDTWIHRATRTLSRRAPVFPAAALASRLPGFATGRIVIAPDGTPTEVSIVDSEPQGVYEQVTWEAMMRWRFERLADGQPVAPRVVCQRFAFSFDRPIPPSGKGAVPRPIRTPMPQFPLVFQRRPQAVQARVAGMVDVEGKPYDIHIAYSDPPGILDDYLMRAVAKWRFEPAQSDGAPVAAPFERDFTFDPRAWQQWERSSYLQGIDAEDVEGMHAKYQRMRSLCPAVFPRADDAVNRALATVRRETAALPESLPEDPRAAYAQYPAVGACLFSSWEHYRDPEVLKVALEYIAPASVLGHIGASPGLEVMRERLSQAPTEPTRFDTPELQALLRYFAGQLMPAYRLLVQEWAATQPAFDGPTPAARAALDAVKAVPETRYDRRVVGTLREALDAASAPLDRAYLSISLANVLFRMGQRAEAIAMVDRLAEDRALPASLRNTARVTLLAYASSSFDGAPDHAAIARALAGLNADLGVERQLTL